MPSITKPIAVHPSLHKNELGLTIRDYEGSMSTLCAGCGHDSITAGIIRACWEISLAPHMLAKMSGIGCSSKTPTYFVGGAHGFNSAHGRMPAIATGANAANRELTYIGVSGDGDSLERNARMQVTVWGGKELHDYAAKEWSGLVGDFYLMRWDRFFDALGGPGYDDDAFRKASAEWELEWCSRTTLPRVRHVDPVEQARKLLADTE